MRRTRPLRDESGAAFAEFALVLPLFLFLIFAMTSYGVMFSFRQTLSQAATEGARAAAIAPPYSDFPSRSARAIESVNKSFAGLSGAAVACGVGGLTCPPPTQTSCGGTGQCITVTLNYAYRAHPRIPLPDFTGVTLPVSLTYTASARVQ